jgi:hypothetical protein
MVLEYQKAEFIASRREFYPSDCSVCAVSMNVSFVWILKALSVFTGSLVSVTLAGAVASQVSKLMRHPISERVIAHITVRVDKDGSAGQVTEHGTGISGWDMEAKGSGRVYILPVRHKNDSQRENLGLHDSNLGAYQSFLLGRGSQDCVTDCGGIRSTCFFADQI